MWYINLRSTPGPGASVAHVDDVTVLSCDDPDGQQISVYGRNLGKKDYGDFLRAVGDRTVVLAVHGFNVGFKDGLNSLAALSQYLQFEFAAAGRQDIVVIGVLWPGDFYHAAINYIWEHIDAVQAGRMLGAFLSRHLPRSRLNLVSHSLGARVVLSCLQGLAQGPQVDEVCLTAPAADADAFRRQYASVISRAASFRVLASKADRTLMLAYPVGDFIADTFVGDDDSPLLPAMGRIGARPLPQATQNYLIPSTFLWLDGRPDRNFDHCDYFPNRTVTTPPKSATGLPKARRKAAIAAGQVLDPKPEQAASTHLGRILLGQWPSWPH